MTTIAKLRICDWSLLVMTAAVLMSGIQLEILGGGAIGWIWGHITLCLLFMGMCAWHIRLHFKKNNWFAKFRGQKSQVTKVLWWLSLITFATGVIASARWIISGTHGPVGAIHGKIGFLMIIVAVAHILKRKNFFYRR